MDGFTLNGRHCESMKLHYIPNENTRAGYAAGWDIHTENDSTKDGSVYYSRRQKEKHFDLKCYYEEITEAELRKIERWLDRSGELIFDALPFCKWNTYPTDMPNITKYPVTINGEKRWTGIIEIKLTAPDPNADLLETSADVDTQAYSMTGLIPERMDPFTLQIDSTSVLVYNPGNVRCGLNIRLSGDSGADGIRFVNEANGQVCTIKEMTAAATTGMSKWIEAEGETMRTFYRGAATEEFGYEFHDDGYIWLEPCGAYEKDLNVTYSGGIVTSEDLIFRPDMLGQYMFIENGWHEIVEVLSDEKVRVGQELASASGDFSGTVVICSMNRIRIERSEDANLDTLELSFSPKMRIR